MRDICLQNGQISTIMQVVDENGSTWSDSLQLDEYMGKGDTYRLFI